MPKKVWAIFGSALFLFTFLMYYTFATTFAGRTMSSYHLLHILPQRLLPRANILFTFIAANTNEARNEIIRENVEALRNRTIEDYHIDCIIFSYSKYADQPKWLKEMADDTGGYCRVVTLYQSSLVGFMKYLDPVFLESAGYSHVVVSLDDVRLHGPQSNFSPKEFFDFVVDFDLAVASPAILGSDWAPTRPMPMEPNQIGHTVNAIELQSTTFRVDAWKCWWELSDTEFPSGWYDLFMHHYCFPPKATEDRSMGIMDMQYAVHERLPSTNPSNAFQIFKDQVDSWKRDRGIDLIPTDPRIGTILYRAKHGQ